jgi:hypothetical protein
MSVLTYMDGVPLYSTINEALEWARFKGISGYNVSKYESVTGYMGGKDCKQASMYPGDLPAKEKIKLGYTPKIGSRVISIADGETSEYVATRYPTKKYITPSLAKQPTPRPIPRSIIQPSVQLPPRPRTQPRTQPMPSSGGY